MNVSELASAIDLDLLRAMPEDDQHLMEEWAALVSTRFTAPDCFRLGVAFGIRQERVHQEAEDTAELERLLKL